MVITLLIPVRQAFGLQAYLRDEHFDNMGKLILITSSIVGYSYGMEYFMAWYSANPYEQMSFWFRGFGHFWWATWTMIICNVIVPLPLWIKKMRTNLLVMWIISIFINIGMWFERFVIVMTSLSHEYDPAVWGYYSPTIVEITVMVGSLAFVLMLFLIFIRMFPVIAIQEVKELHYEESH
jgi:molybdopterin-containing oxidoreductase family membrane subunit